MKRREVVREIAAWLRDVKKGRPVVYGLLVQCAQPGVPYVLEHGGDPGALVQENAIEGGVDILLQHATEDDRERAATRLQANIYALPAGVTLRVAPIPPRRS